MKVDATTGETTLFFKYLLVHSYDTTLVCTSKYNSKLTGTHGKTDMLVVKFCTADSYCIEKFMADYILLLLYVHGIANHDLKWLD